MADLGSLASAFRGAYGVFNVQNPMISGIEGEILQGKNVAKAAKEAGVRHLVYGSAGTGVAGTSVPSRESKLVVQTHMEALGLPLTVLRPMAFMELMTDKDFYPPVSMWHLMPKLIGESQAIPWLCADDLGAIAALAFANPSRFVGTDLRLAAEYRTLPECRQIWQDVTGQRPRRFPMPVWLFERFVGPDLTTMWRWLREHAVDTDPAQTQELLPAVTTVREWLTRRQSR